jgi:hypothetical protein
MKHLFNYLTALVLVGSAGAQSVELPREVAADPGVFAIVSAKTDCASLRWYVIDPGLSIIPSELLRDSKTAIVMSGKPGRYRLLAYGAKGDAASVPAVCTVVIGEVPPVPPGPNPPIPPIPPDPLVGKFQEAYKAETDPKKFANLSTFIVSMETVIPRLQSQGSVTTTQQLQDGVRAANDAAIGASALPVIRKAVGAYLVTVLPTTDRSMDAALWSLATSEYAKVVKALKGVQP